MELNRLDLEMKEQISKVRDKYKKMKKEVRNKYSKEKSKSIPKTVKNDVWDRYIGKEKGIGKCTCCSKEIDSKNFDCGHVIAAACGGNETVDNLRPLCGICNKSMKTQNLFEFKQKYYPEKNYLDEYMYIQVDTIPISLDDEIKQFFRIKTKMNSELDQ